MARRRRGRPVNGILLLDKPSGMSSNAALQTVKRLYFAAKAGHTGNLDPLATGVLPICFGEATKFSQYLLDADKAYLTTIAFGISTDTYDADGEILTQADASQLALPEIEQALEAFQGEIEQVPPMYSALKRNGQPLYKLARAGQEVEREARRVRIYETDVQGFRPGEVAELDLYVSCSKGTYIRSIAADLGAALGFGAHVKQLRRLQAGPFSIEAAVTIETLQGLRDSEAFAAMDELLMAADAALDHLPLVEVNDDMGFYVRQGQPVLVPHMPTQGLVRICMEGGEFLGVGEILDDGRVAPKRLLASGG